MGHIKKYIKPKDEDNLKDMISVEYFLLNIPQTISSEDPTEFIQNLVNCNDLELFETLPIQTIIRFKWDNYAKRFFGIKFGFFGL